MKYAEKIQLSGHKFITRCRLVWRHIYWIRLELPQTFIFQSFLCFRPLSCHDCELCSQLFPSTGQLENVLLRSLSIFLLRVADFSRPVTSPLHKHHQWLGNIPVRAIHWISAEAKQDTSTKIRILHLRVCSDGINCLPRNFKENRSRVRRAGSGTTRRPTTSLSVITVYDCDALTGYGFQVCYNINSVF